MPKVIDLNREGAPPLNAAELEREFADVAKVVRSLPPLLGVEVRMLVWTKLPMLDHPAAWRTALNWFRAGRSPTHGWLSPLPTTTFGGSPIGCQVYVRAPTEAFLQIGLSLVERMVQLLLRIRNQPELSCMASLHGSIDPEHLWYLVLWELADPEIAAKLAGRERWSPAVDVRGTAGVLLDDATMLADRSPLSPDGIVAELRAEEPIRAFYIPSLLESSVIALEKLRQLVAAAEEPTKSVPSGEAGQTSTVLMLDEDGKLLIDCLRRAECGLTAKALAGHMNERHAQRVRESAQLGIKVSPRSYSEGELQKRIIPKLKELGHPIENRRGMGYLLRPADSTPKQSAEPPEG